MRNRFFLPFLIAVLAGQAWASDRIVTTVDSTHADNVVLSQTFTVNAPVSAVWAAYTTSKGYRRWAAPVAEVDLRIGGTVKANYTPGGSLNDSTAIVLNILNYVPEQLLTLQAEIRTNFPAFTVEEQQRFSNVILFEAVDDTTTRVTSHGIGYQNNPKHMGMLNYFAKANTAVHGALIDYLEK